MFWKSEFVAYTPEALLDLVVLKLQAQGNYRIGERLRGPVDQVWDGKLVQPKVDLPVVSLDRPIPHVDMPAIPVNVMRVKLNLRQLDNIILTDVKKWLYPWAAAIPHAEWMRARFPGERVHAMDDQFDTTPYTLTEQDFLDHEYLIFSYATTD